jgi:thiol-disulfide isomerase/thioredoxin
MKNLKRKLLLPLFAFGLFATFAEAKITYKYMPLMIDEGMSVVLPYGSVNTYTPPVDSLDHTTVETVDGTKMRVDLTPEGMVFEGHEGQIVLLEVYGHSCPHCVASIPGLNRLQAKYQKEVFVLAIESYGLTNTELIQYVKDKRIAYSTAAKEKSGSILSFVTRLTGSIPGVPWLMIFSQDGKLAENPHLGDLPEAEVDSTISTLLDN